MKEYDHKDIEEKWQKYWTEKQIYRTEEDKSKLKCYVLDMFPYPSGEGLHVGHPKGYIATDVYSRYKHMQGFNVLHPMGWDAFGLPAEQYAIKNQIHPRVAVEKNTTRFKEQLAKIGFNYDWSREINTTDPKFYKWTQWIFLQLYKNGLAYESFAPINWCPTCQTGLANEDLEGGKCERCGTVVEKKPMRQWTLKITEYADRMLADLDSLEWPESIKESQRNWIGRSEGAEIEFALHNVPGQEEGKHKLKVFTTRPDTLFGATYVAISAELAKNWIDLGWEVSAEVKKFALDTLEEEKVRAVEYGEVAEKKGIASGVYAVNPANQEEIPVWIANYVLSGYGTGAIMAVPAHDERDFDFAKKFNLPIVDVIAKKYVLTGENADRAKVETLDRRIVDPILVDRDGNLYLVKEGPLHVHFAGGGVDDGEDEQTALAREIKEELGYTDFTIGRRLLPQIIVEGYRHTKNKNQHSVGPAFEVMLNSDARVSSEIEDGKHELVKVSLADAKDTITWEHHRFILDRYLSGDAAYSEYGTLVNSGKFNGMDSNEAIKAITEFVGGKMTKQYRLKDWVFSRQRYWGEPIPIVHDALGKVYPVDESELPVVLPNVESYAPTGTGESPLADISDWVNVDGYITDDGTFKEVKEGESGAQTIQKFKRETNTMPQWAGSSWYYLRYIDPTNDTALVDHDKEKFWSPVDMYVGGAEHATRHLIYARFWHKFLYDLGIVNHTEPFNRLQNVGLIMASDGRKMSKRHGNVINPDDVVKTFGADSLRIYEMFMGPFDQSIAWSTDNMVGARRFIERVWRMKEKIGKDTPIERATETLLHQTIKKVGGDIERFGFNTAISQLMILVNHLEKLSSIPQAAYEDLLRLVAPFAPHVAEELWSELGHETQIYAEVWPTYDAEKSVTEKVNIAIQINGKVRDAIEILRTDNEESVKSVALARPQVQKWLDGKEPQKVIYVAGKIVNIVL